MSRVNVTGFCFFKVNILFPPNIVRIIVQEVFIIADDDVLVAKEKKLFQIQQTGSETLMIRRS